MSTVPDSEDRPASEIPPIALWSESYAFWSWDDANDLTIYAHFQRHPEKPTLWRAYACVARTDGVYAFHSYGVAPSPDHAGFAGCAITVERPHKVWRLRVAGAARRQTHEELRRAAITDGPAIPLFIDAELRLATPVWSLPHGSKDATAVMPTHYEQTGTIEGTLTLGGERFAMRCPGANDHSRGVRDTSTLKDGGFFFNGVFPGGRSLTAIKMGAGADAGQLGYVCRGDGKIRQATHVVAPEAAWPEPNDRGKFTLEAEGRPETVNFEVTRRRVLLTMVPPNYEHVGLAEGERTKLYYCDWTCRLEWDGEVGWGSWEAARRHDG